MPPAAQEPFREKVPGNLPKLFGSTPPEMARELERFVWRRSWARKSPTCPVEECNSGETVRQEEEFFWRSPVLKMRSGPVNDPSGHSPGRSRIFKTEWGQGDVCPLAGLGRAQPPGRVAEGTFSTDRFRRRGFPFGCATARLRRDRRRGWRDRVSRAHG